MHIHKSVSFKNQPGTKWVSQLLDPSKYKVAKELKQLKFKSFYRLGAKIWCGSICEVSTTHTSSMNRSTMIFG